MSSEPEVTGHTYGVELLFDRDYDLADPALRRAIAAACPMADLAGEGAPIAIFHRDVPIQLADASVCAQTAILPTDHAPAPRAYAPLVAQSREWPEAGAAVARATRSLLVTDLMSSSLPAPQRLQVFQRTLGAVVSNMRPIAIAWRPAGKLVEPQSFLAAMASSDPADRVFHALNVRLFTIENDPGACVMDTMGLGALMLPDLQLQSRNLDLNAVARHLYNSAYYVFQVGDVIEDGNTIEGIERGQKWRCTHEDALVGPHRVVLDLDPGPPWAAGNRTS
jgi:hypothetical protein